MLEGTDASFERCFLGRRHIRVRNNVPVLVRLYIRLSVFAFGIMLLSQVSLFYSYSYFHRLPFLHCIVMLSRWTLHDYLGEPGRTKVCISIYTC